MMSPMADKAVLNPDFFSGWEKEFGVRSLIRDREGGEVSGLRAGGWLCQVRSQSQRSASDRLVREMLFESFCHPHSRNLETYADGIICAVLMCQIFECGLSEPLLTILGCPAISLWGGQEWFRSV